MNGYQEATNRRRYAPTQNAKVRIGIGNGLREKNKIGFYHEQTFDHRILYRRLFRGV